MPSPASRERYVAAALEILTEQGSSQLTMTALHRRLAVSSGSFYHFFRGWDDFVRQFLDSWIAQTQEISARARAAEDPFDRLEMLRFLTSTVPHAAESAIRVWGASDPVVEEAQSQIDRQRLTIIHEAVASTGIAEPAAADLARHGLSIIVGWQQLSRPFDMDELDTMLCQFVELVRRSAPVTGL